ncbi:MAG TPA: FHA domain-containing protein [Thermoanaerobaculaceae bacterium]|nr:FHA domain-containing protein [Thermoanaerobaculaceae bacterium]
MPKPGGRGDAPPAEGGASSGGPPAVNVTVVTAAGTTRQRSFTQAFRLGRGEECEVRVAGKDVSRIHAEVVPRGTEWSVRDLGSTNGTFLDGERVHDAKLPARCELQLGTEEVRVLLRIGEDTRDAADATMVDAPRDEAYYIHHYVEHDKTGHLGQRTIMIRQAVADVMRKRRRHYVWIIGLVVALGLGAGGYAIYQHRELAKQRALAEAIFYQMKTVELQLAQLEAREGPVPDAKRRAELAADRTRFADLEHSYDGFLSELGVYDPKMTPEQRLILRIARVYGECELAMPDGFIDEVDRYIDKWKADERLVNSIRRANANHYAPIVINDMTKNHLPPQFFYLALEESNFQVELCGPETRYGIPKGAWQFIPETAIAYGLRTGPLYLLRQSDPRDERHDFAKATGAAARYLRDIYDKEAQASGLLVIASYNWGENNILQLIRSMPENPRDRNFWQLLTKHRRQIPRETYAYVFMVFSAAVIGENPHLFGFDFDNPLTAGRPAKG